MVHSFAVRWQLVSRIADDLSATGDPRSAYAFGSTCGAFDGPRAVRSWCLGAVRPETSRTSALGQKMTSAIKACLRLVKSMWKNLIWHFFCDRFIYTRISKNVFVKCHNSSKHADMQQKTTGKQSLGHFPETVHLDTGSDCDQVRSCSVRKHCSLVHRYGYTVCVDIYIYEYIYIQYIYIFIHILHT